MPFTASHPAAVLPLMRLGLPASAVVIGSLVPDLPYYLPTSFTFVETHSFTGAFTVDLLLGLVAFGTWHWLLAPPLLWAAPGGVQRRVPRPHPRALVSGARAVAQVCLALVVGALTHIAWDRFTHADGLSLNAIPALNTPVMDLPLYRWLHLVSSVVGLALLIWYGARWWVRAPAHGPANPIHPAIRWGVGALLVGWAGFAAAGVVGPAEAAAVADRQLLVIDVLLVFIGTLLKGLLLAAVMWHMWQVLARLTQTAVARDPRPLPLGVGTGHQQRNAANHHSTPPRAD